MTHTLRYDPSRRGRSNTFDIRRHGSLWRLEAWVRTTDAAVVHHVFAWLRLSGPGVERGRDPEAKPALFFSRHGEDLFLVEHCRLDFHLPPMFYALVGFDPGS